MSEIERKNLAAVEVKIADESAGVVEAIVGVTGNLDDGGDVIAPGTFAESLERRGLPALMAGHDWRKDVGVIEAAEELMPGDSRLPADLRSDGFGGVLVRARYNLDADDAEARQVFSRIKFKAQYGPRTQQWSIGYIPTDVEFISDVRHIKAMDWLEASSVAVAMNQAVYTLAVKSLEGAPEDVATWIKAHANGGEMPEGTPARVAVEEAWAKWVGLFDGDTVERIDDLAEMIEAAKTLENKTAKPVHHTETTEDEWDGPGAVADAPNDAEVLWHMHAWRDEDGEPDAKASYKFPHHGPSDGSPANLPGVRNALARLSQSDIPAGDMADVEAHLRAHLDDSQEEESAQTDDIVLRARVETARLRARHMA